MRVVDVLWTPTVNHIVVACGCGARFAWPMNVDLMTCGHCGGKAWTHEGGRVTWRHLCAPDALPPVAASHTHGGRGG